MMFFIIKFFLTIASYQFFKNYTKERTLCKKLYLNLRKFDAYFEKSTSFVHTYSMKNFHMHDATHFPTFSNQFTLLILLYTKEIPMSTFSF